MIEIGSVREMENEAAAFASRIAPQKARATAVALSGALGAGKTTFAQALAKALGVEEVVTSPTFVIEKIYRLQGQKFARLVHVDAYRLNGSNELRTLGFEELLGDSGNLILIEWPERVMDIIPETAIRIEFDIAGDGRIITINGEEKN